MKVSRFTNNINDFFKLVYETEGTCGFFSSYGIIYKMKVDNLSFFLFFSVNDYDCSLKIWL